MIGPTVTPRIEQVDNLPRNRINTGYVRAFAEIAAVTAKGQIAVFARPTMLAGYDVPDVMRKGPDEYPRCRRHRLRGVGKLPAGL